jgi:hypothetical protein
MTYGALFTYMMYNSYTESERSEFKSMSSRSDPYSRRKCLDNYLRWKNSFEHLNFENKMKHFNKMNPLSLLEVIESHILYVSKQNLVTTAVCLEEDNQFTCSYSFDIGNKESLKASVRLNNILNSGN